MTGGTRTPMPALHKELLRIAIFAVGVALLLNLLDSGVALNFVMMALYAALLAQAWNCLLYTSPSPRDRTRSRMPSSA